MADIGWITGHSYIVYGPLALGTTTVIYEGVPNYPDAGRPWRIAEKLGVNIFHTSPTAIRMLRKVGPDEPEKYNYHFKHMTTVGEPIEPEVWRWYYTEVGKGEAAIVDTWWQTENGGFMGSTLPALDPMKPGSCGPAVLGIYPVIYDENGDEVPAGRAKRATSASATPGPASSRRSGATRTDSCRPTSGSTTRTGKQGLARLAVLRRRRRDPRGRRVLPDPGPGGRRDQRGRAPAGHQGDRVRRADRPRGRRSGRRSGDRRDSGPRVEIYVSLKPGFAAGRRSRRRSPPRSRRRSEDRPAKERVDRRGHAQDPVGEDHAAGHRGGLELRRRRRRHHAGQPRGGGAASGIRSRLPRSRKGEVPRELTEAEAEELRKFGDE